MIVNDVTCAPSDIPIAHHALRRDALNVRLSDLDRLRTEADEAWIMSKDKDSKSREILKEFFEEAERREYAVDHEMADVCRTILLASLTSTEDLILKAQTVAFIASQKAIWSCDDFQEEIVAFAKQVSDWAADPTAKNGAARV